MLSVKNLSKTFGTRKIINDVSFDVPQGDIAILLEPSGIGKSTLLRVLNNLETIDAGTISLNKKPLDLSAANTEHTCGMVFQQFNLFPHMSVLENITFPLQKGTNSSSQQAKEIGEKLLKQYNLLDKKNAYPSQLSGGQKQRLALARTIALRPKIICFDEPTSALDPLLTSHVAQTIQELANDGYIVLIATHDTALLDKLRCTIYLMDEGNIVETAESQNLTQSPTDYPRISKFVAGAIE